MIYICIYMAVFIYMYIYIYIYIYINTTIYIQPYNNIQYSYILVACVWTECVVSFMYRVVHVSFISCRHKRVAIGAAALVVLPAGWSRLSANKLSGRLFGRLCGRLSHDE